MTMPALRYLCRSPGYIKLFTLANPAAADTDSLVLANVPVTHQFNPDGAPAVELYWTGTNLPGGSVATLKALRFDGLNQAFIYAASLAGTPANTSIIVPTEGSTLMAVLLTSITAVGSTNLSVMAAQAFGELFP